ncbi:MAG: AMP-binding protein [Saprospiraceae bacterium]|nr:AMP-binding protein [Saprospiraceae bacterium]
MKAQDLLFQAARQWPRHIAIYDSRGAMTYDELAQTVRRFSRFLSDSGVQPGMGVGVLGDNSRHFIAWVFAVMDAGAVVMPISSQLKVGELADILQTARLHAVIEEKNTALSAQLPVIAGEAGWQLAFNTAVDPQQPFAPHVPEAALVRFTSGTTGVSKGVILSHASIEERTAAANKVLELGPGDVVVWILQMAYHFVVSIILYLRYGASIAICDNFIADTIIETTNRYVGSFLYASPMHIRLLANDRSDRQMPSLRRVISTSTGLAVADSQAFTGRWGLPVAQAYGIIEIGLPIINLVHAGDAPGAVGYSLPDYRVGILDEQLQELPDGETGQLAIRGPGMFAAYLQPPKLREDILQNGWFLTGDLASRRPDGLLTIEGRKKSMINVSGNKVFPEEVEAVLNTHPAVAMSRVKGAPHPFLGECVSAEVVLHPGAEVDAETLITYCRQRLSTYKVPQRLAFVSTLPMTDSGKLRRG